MKKPFGINFHPFSQQDLAVIYKYFLEKLEIFALFFINIEEMENFKNFNFCAFSCFDYTLKEPLESSN
jgi:hypothetical protein